MDGPVLYGGGNCRYGHCGCEQEDAEQASPKQRNHLDVRRLIHQTLSAQDKGYFCNVDCGCYQSGGLTA